MVKFKSIFTKFENEDKRLDAFVPLTKLRKSAIFTMKLVPESNEDEYAVFIRGERKSDVLLDDVVRRFEEYFMYGSSSYPARYRNNRLPPNILTPYSMHRSMQMQKSNIVTHSNLRFPEAGKNELDENDTENEISGPKTEIETFSDKEITLNPARKNFSMNQFDADIVTVRASNLIQQCGTKVEMGTQSQVLIGPGTTGQLYFELTNLRSEPVLHNVRVVDERSYLLRLFPQNVLIQPEQTVTITLSVIIPRDAPQGTTDRITFTAQGPNGVLATVSVNLKVSNLIDIKDTTAPTLTWEFGTRCDYIAADSPNCADRFWMLDIKAQDWESGVLRIQSNPPGLWYRNSYTVGSVEPLRATYMATCCDPRVSLSVHDIAGNQRSYTIDVRDIVLNEASIAAIVLGALLLLVIIILIIASIVWCCRRRKTTINLPTYRSHSTRSME